MKKIIIALISMMILIPVAGNAQNKALNKKLKKEYKDKKKELEKQGWKLFGSSRTLDVALLLHYDKLNVLGKNGTEVNGYASISDPKHKNLLKQNAIANACNTYARNTGSHVKGRTVNDMGLTDSEKSEFEHFYAAYEAIVEKEIKGELKESFALIKEDVGKKQIDMQVFYVVDEEAASRARIRAFENAMKESEVAQKYAEKVSEFIKEGFKNE
ncbi:MAG: hypothetical protein J6W03_07435 [Bacteroidaceae bacterium]|nr:hypothetical protein [Bacteroidaceae bacterium]